jgi:putative peptidoglycan binding protein
MQPRMNSSFVNRPALTHNNTAWRQRRLSANNDWRESSFNPRPRPADSFANRSALSDAAARRHTRLALNNRWADSDFRERPRTNSSFVNRSVERDAVARRQTRQSFNDYWANSNFRERLGTNGAFANRSRNTAFWSGTRGAFTNNWRGSEFSGRQYSAFQNYQPQWHDSGWWDNCGDQIVFVAVYSQPFPFYFDAGYWYPAWGYYPDAYYPYDGPIYGYNDLPPDEIIENVQIELYNQGYLSGPIDGILGPDTQAAIADYQADHGLAVTAAIDEPTVESLGLV